MLTRRAGCRPRRRVRWGRLQRDGNLSRFIPNAGVELVAVEAAGKGSTPSTTPRPFRAAGPACFTDR